MITTMIRRSRTTGRKHRLSVPKSRVAKLSHRKFKHHKRSPAVRLKISRAVKRTIRTKRTVTGLRVRKHRI